MPDRQKDGRKDRQTLFYRIPYFIGYHLSYKLPPGVQQNDKQQQNYMLWKKVWFWNSNFLIHFV